MDLNSRKMSEFTKVRQWIPTLVALLGVGLSVALSFIFWLDIDILKHVHPIFQLLLPWILLFFGVVLSLAIATLISRLQYDTIQLDTLHELNENLEKEIAERKTVEESKQKLESALQQGQKLQAMGTLAGGIAHDFNNILYAINGYVEMAREDVEKNTLIYANLGKVLEASVRGQELISRILAFSRKHHHQMSELNIKKTLEAVFSLLSPTIPASVTLHFSTEKNDIFIMGNQTDLHQVFVNLINNAVDAMDGEGDITIKIKLLPAEDSNIPSRCHIEITDTGTGMDSNTIERIFEPFYTTKEVGKGTGLGLSIVHSIIKEHQGNITVTSELGKGTTFTILLPAIKATIGEEVHG